MIVSDMIVNLIVFHKLILPKHLFILLKLHSPGSCDLKVLLTKITPDDVVARVTWYATRLQCRFLCEYGATMGAVSKLAVA